MVSAGTTTLTIDEIQVVDRHRKDLGSLDALRESIAAVGLLHPVVVTRGCRLIAGERRIAAAVQLGWTEIPVTVAESLDDARTALRAERDENVCRKDMTPSEKVALGRELEKLERGPAARRKTEGQRLGGLARHQLEGNFPSSSETTLGDRTGKVYDLVGEAVEMSGPTYKRAKAVVDAAITNEPGGAEALRQMDTNGKVAPAYDQLQAAKVAARVEFADLTQRQKENAAASKLRVEKAIGTCNGIARGFDLLKIHEAVLMSSAEEIEGWDSAVADAIATLHRLRKRLKEATS